MLKTQIYITEEQQIKLRKLSRKTGRKQSELVRSAIDDFLARAFNAPRGDALLGCRGMWKDRKRTEFRAIRELIFMRTVLTLLAFFVFASFGMAEDGHGTRQSLDADIKWSNDQKAQFYERMGVDPGDENNVVYEIHEVPDDKPYRFVLPGTLRGGRDSH